MSDAVASHPFCRSGIAALSDLSSSAWRQSYDLLEQEQARFLKFEREFRSPDYPWPRDPLHDWSRAWEYPYVFHQLKRFRDDWTSDRLPKVLDVGSGVTFFPFALARMGFEVICSDVDPICERDLSRAIASVEHGPGRISFRRTNGTKVPCPDEEADATYCISVLEHVPGFEELVGEMARSLKPGGLFVLTVDLDLRGDWDLGVEKHRTLLRTLEPYFQYKWPEQSVHPADVLTSLNAPFAPKLPVGLARQWFLLKQNVLKRMIGRKPRPLAPFLLAIQSFTMVRRRNGRDVGRKQ